MWRFWRFLHPFQWMEGYDYMHYGAGCPSWRAKKRPLLFRLLYNHHRRQWERHFFCDEEGRVCWKTTGERVEY